MKKCDILYVLDTCNESETSGKFEAPSNVHRLERPLTSEDLAVGKTASLGGPDAYNLDC